MRYVLRPITRVVAFTIDYILTQYVERVIKLFTINHDSTVIYNQALHCNPARVASVMGPFKVPSVFHT